MDPYDPPLDRARHLRYWQRCVRTLLPHHYTSMDSTRLSLGFFIVCSVDLLTPSPTPSTTTPSSGGAKSTPDKALLTPTDRLNLRQWVLSCQHPQGGFCASPTHVFPRAYQHDDTENAHIGGTYFALLILALLADDDNAEAAFAGVDRVRTLRWLRRLQRPEDGSFGEIVYDPPALGKEETRTEPPKPVISGGRDMRYSYLASAVRWMLRGDLSSDDPAFVPDIDVPALVAHIRRGQTYDGGFAESWRHESHAGYGYCAVAALALLDRPLEGASTGASSRTVRDGVADRAGFVSWLMSRQFAYVGGSDGDDNDDYDDPETSNFRLADLMLSDEEATDAQYIGFNGRCNKVADTCYTWWTLGSLAVLDADVPHGKQQDTDEPASLKARRAFLLEKTQHLIGGFGKHPGSPPDVGHACLGLAALATMGDPGLKRLDPALCVSVETVGKIEKARRGLLGRRGENHESTRGGVDLGLRLVDVAYKMRGDGGEKPGWLDAVS